jgi:hypothetical protein
MNLSRSIAVGLALVGMIHARAESQDTEELARDTGFIDQLKARQGQKVE